MRGDGTVYQRGSVFYCQFFVNGAKRIESTGVRVPGEARKVQAARKEAERYLRKRLQEIASGTPVDAARLTFERLADLIEADYSVNARRSTRSMRRCVRHLRARFAGCKAQDIPRQASSYIAARLKEGASQASVNRELSALRRALNLAFKQGLLATRYYIPRLQERNVRTGFLEDGVLAKILTHLRPHLCPLVEFLALTGWRRSEGQGLLWRSVDLEGGVVRLSPDETKGGEARVFPFAKHPRLRALLEAQRARCDAIGRERSRIVANVFPKPDGEPLRDWYAAWRSAARKAGAPGAIVHDLRRGAARSMERAGVARSVSMKLLGHRTPAIFQRYAITTESDLSDGVARLAAAQKRSAKPKPKRGQVVGMPKRARSRQTA